MPTTLKQESPTIRLSRHSFRFNRFPRHRVDGDGGHESLPKGSRGQSSLSRSTRKAGLSPPYAITLR